MQEQQCHTWPQAGSHTIVSSGHYLVEQIETQYPKKTVAGYIVS